MSRRNFLNLLDRAERFMSVLFLSGIVLAILLQVFFRYVLNSPLIGPEELATLLYIWLVFIGADIALRRGEHVSIDMLVNIFPNKLRLVSFLVTQISMLTICVVIVIYGIPLLRLQATSRTAALRIPVYISSLPLVISAFLMTLNLMLRIVASVRKVLKAKKELGGEKVGSFRKG